MLQKQKKEEKEKFKILECRINKDFQCYNQN